MNISIFGLGYVGCVSLGCLAKNGFKVKGIDSNEVKVNLINKGIPTIIENGITEIISGQFAAGNISATKDYEDAVMKSDVSIICVGTPSTKEGHLNLGYIFKTAEQIGRVLRKKKSFHLLIIRSTVMPGTNKKYTSLLEEFSGKDAGKDFDVVSNPEFLREGSAVSDFYNPPFTLIGAENDNAFEMASGIYKDIKAPVVKVSVEVAELIKYVNNSFHALKITFANEIGNICKKLNIDSHELMEIFTKDNKLNISSAYLKPGFAYGGSCLPKDLKGLRTIAHDHYIKTPVLDSIEISNDNQKKLVLDFIESTEKKRIGIIGLSFKSGTDDLRYSPMLEISELLFGKGYTLKIFDENVRYSNLIGANKEYLDNHLPHLKDLLVESIDELPDSSDVIIISQKHESVSSLIEKNPTVTFLDLVKLPGIKSPNYYGICW